MGVVCDLTRSQLVAMHGSSCSAPEVPVYGDTELSIKIQSWPSLLSRVCRGNIVSGGFRG